VAAIERELDCSNLTTPYTSFSFCMLSLAQPSRSFKEELAKGVKAR
jgi:hypothetical protein